MDESIQKTSTRSDFTRDLQSMLHEGEAMLKNAGKQLRKEYRSARDKVASSVEPVTSQASPGLSTVEDSLFVRTRSAARNTDRYVQNHPWQAAAAGACLGFIVGIVIRRK
ncbi:MAG: DUF883 domain-containing protein [Herminiimonas sp.]|nr:DUF883 domain-containing protein [Herminiimonas sp.]